jgi:predicted nucleic acid-binding protein
MSPRRPQDEAALGAFLAYVGVLDFPDQAALDYAKIRVDLQKKGTIIAANDLFICSACSQPRLDSGNEQHT